MTYAEIGFNIPEATKQVSFFESKAFSLVGSTKKTVAIDNLMLVITDKNGAPIRYITSL